LHQLHTNPYPTYTFPATSKLKLQLKTNNNNNNEVIGAVLTTRVAARVTRSSNFKSSSFRDAHNKLVKYK